MYDTSVHPQNNSGTSVPFCVKFFATGFFSGYSKIAPGTAGSIVALLLYAIPFFESPLILTVAIISFFIIGVYTSKRMEKSFGDDPPIVVIDEIVGMWISLAFLPKTLFTTSLAFLFFRFFDIFKPPPCRQLEGIKNGWGVMLDDVMAGIYANLTTQFILFSFSNL
jgi:phosphatidylglycerophosphatase A